MDKMESIRITFFKTFYYLLPTDDEVKPTPEEYKISVKLPSQSADEMIIEEDQFSTLQKFILTNILLSFVTSNSLQLMFGSIISLQILAHLPLVNMNLPANAEGSFDIMVNVVSFDVFELHKVVDLGFTKTEPWSEKFNYLDYESINFIEGMGSIMIMMWLGFLYLILVFIIKMIR